MRCSWSESLSILLTVAVLVAAPSVTSAQSAAPPAAIPITREAELLAEREKKATELEPYKPSGLEKGMTLLEKRVFPTLGRDGLYTKFGSISIGSGTAYGAGYRDHTIAGGRGEVDAWAAGSFKGYWALNGRVRHPIAPASKLFVDAYARQYAYPREEFTGIGPDTTKADRVAYTHKGRLAGVGLSAEPARHVLVGGGMEWQWPTIEGGTSPAWPSIETRFDPVSAPGLNGASRFVRPNVYVAYDNREPRNPRKGGLYRVDVSHVDDRASRDYSFTRYDIDLRHYIGLFEGRRLFALRAMATTTSVDGDDQIPFYLQPTLGGNDSLRGFRALRFRGPNRLLLQGEYRWDIWSGLEGAFFFDAGKVALKRSDLDFSRLEKDWGFGFRFNTDNGVVFRVDTAFGSRDGAHLHIVFGGVF
jgi:hypothetical protein